MISAVYTVNTGNREELADITPVVRKFIRENSLSEGICHIFIPHTTCGVTINENADPDVKRDILMELAKIVPFSDGYRHIEGNSDAHIKASMMGFSASIPVSGGAPVLGTWQGIYLCEFDGPRTRKVRLSFIR